MSSTPSRRCRSCYSLPRSPGSASGDTHAGNRVSDANAAEPFDVMICANPSMTIAGEDHPRVHVGACFQGSARLIHLGDEWAPRQMLVVQSVTTQLTAALDGWQIRTSGRSAA